MIQRIATLQMHTVKEFIKKGGKLDAIKAKYNISSEIEAKLTTL